MKEIFGLRNQVSRHIYKVSFLRRNPKWKQKGKEDEKATRLVFFLLIPPHFAIFALLLPYVEALLQNSFIRWNAEGSKKGKKGKKSKGFAFCLLLLFAFFASSSLQFK